MGTQVNENQQKILKNRKTMLKPTKQVNMKENRLAELEHNVRVQDLKITQDERTLIYWESKKTSYIFRFQNKEEEQEEDLRAIITQ